MTRLFVLGAFAVLLSQQAAAQTREAPVLLAEDAACKAAGLPTKLPNMLTVFTAIQKLPLSKDQYESSSAYEARVSTTLATALPGGARLFAYLKIPDSYGSYDADAGILTFVSSEISASFDFFSGAPARKFGPTYYRGVMIDERGGRPSKYVGQNAFGATAVVTMRDTARREIAVRNFSGSIRTATTMIGGNVYQIPSIKTWGVAIRIAPGAARVERRDMQIVVSGPLAAPFKLDAEDYSSPTIDVPIGGSQKTSAIYIQADCAYIRNAKTGIVYTAFKLPEND